MVPMMYPMLWDHLLQCTTYGGLVPSRPGLMLRPGFWLLVRPGGICMQSAIVGLWLLLVQADWHLRQAMQGLECVDRLKSIHLSERTTAST